MLEVEKIVKQAKLGNAEAIKKLYEAYTPRVRNICAVLTKNDSYIVEDLVQEVFIRVFKSLPSLRDDSKFEEWLCIITQNTVLSFLKQNQKKRFLPLATEIVGDIESDASMATDAYLEEKDLQELIHLLPSGYRKVFQLAIIEGYSHKEIAALLGIEPHSSSSQLARAKALLRKMIKERTLATIIMVLAGIPIGLYMLKFKRNNEPLPVNKGTDKPAQSTAAEIHMSKDKPLNNSDILKKDVAQSTVSCNKAEIDIESFDTLKALPITANNKLMMAKIGHIPITSTAITLSQDSHNSPISNKKIEPNNNKWQLLAGGTLAQALAQNASKPLTGLGNEGAESDSPDITDTFHTWESVYQHLDAMDPSTLTQKDAALKEIAKNNNGEIIEHKHHHIPLTFEFSVSKNINSRWGIESGMQYTFLKSDFTLGQKGYRVDREQKIHYLGLPLRFLYKWLDKTKWSIYISAGGTLHIPLNGSTKEHYINESRLIYADNWHFTPPLQWSIGTGIGVQYKVSNNWSIYAEPSVMWYIPNGSSITTSWTAHPCSMTFPIGIRVSW